MKIFETGNYKLAAIEAGDVNSEKIAILLPGRLDTKDYANFVSHLDFLARRGYYSIAIDPPSTWESPGDLRDYTTTNYVNAVNELIGSLGDRSTLLVGHSRGGATAMLVSDNPAVKGVAVINAAYGKPSEPKPEKIIDGTLRESRDIPPGSARTDEQIIFELQLDYFTDGAKHNPRAALERFAGPKLIIHANRDEFVSMERINEIYNGLSDPKMFVKLDCTHDYRLYPEAIERVENALDDFLPTLQART